jgi:enoyl-CoA hydratase/carnithine racemase
VTEGRTMQGDAVTLEWSERGVAVATMTRVDAMNTLSLELIEELSRIVALTRQQRARALIITGSGRAFCCGAHLKYFEDPASPIGATPEDIRDKYLWRIATLFDSFEELPFPTIAAINGYALGGGFEMALACDFRIMSKSAGVGLPEVVLGATPGAGGVQKLHRFVGRGKALEWILLGRHLTAAEIEPYGLLYAVVEPDAVLATALELARALKALSPNAIAQAKTSIYIADDADSRSARRAGIEALTRTYLKIA